MRIKWNKQLSLFLVMTMLVSMLPVYAAAADGEEEINPVNAIVHYVNHSDTTKLSSMATYLKNSKTYTKDEKTYLRVDVQQVYEVEFLLEGKEGTQVGDAFTAQTVGYGGKPSEATFITYDYEVPEVTEVLDGSVSYFVEGRFTETQTHDVFVVINNDIDTVKAELAAAITEAEKVTTPPLELETALEAAVAANNYITKKEDMEVALADLKTVMLTLPVSAIVHYVNHSDTTKLSSMATYLKNAKTYTKDEKTYLRVDVQQVYEVEFLLEGKKGTQIGDAFTAQTVGYGGKPSEATFITYDYEVSEVTEVLDGSVSYFVEGRFTETQTHDVYVVINNDIDTVKAELATAIEAAGEATSPKEELKAAITAAKAANNYITKKADMQTALTALTTALANKGNSGGSTPPTGSTPVINEATGLEVGKYYVPVTILQANGNEASYMNQYVLDDARLDVSKNSLTVYLLLGSASMIQSFTVNGSKASVSDDYKADDIKRYKFSASSLTSNLKGSVHVIVNEPPVEYNTTHNIQISFGDAYQVDKWENEGYSKGGSVTPVETVDKDKEKEEENKQEESNNGSTNPTNPTKPTVAFSDVSNHWAKQAIDRAISLGLVNGYSDGTFKPNSTVNRAEFTAIIARAMKLEAKVTEVTFADANNIQSWAQPYIQQALQAGIINGFSDNTFRPTANVNRADMTVMIVKALNLPLVDASELDFKDADQIPAYAKAYIATAVKYGLITGFTDHTFGAAKEATRSEAITMVLRAVDQAAKK